MARMQTDTFREWIRWKYERAPATNPKPFFAMEEARDWTNVLQGTAFLCFRLKKHNDRYQKRHRITTRACSRARGDVSDWMKHERKERGIAKLLEFNSYLLLDVKNSALTYRINEELLVGYIYDRTKCYRVKGSQEGILTLTIGDLCYRLKG
ncbi:uncharacterized protein LOC122513568 isoform X6 [Polistes fuscatus]|uniref:uncharacterized protein LOC122513568 isoform X6 n=1 Tax=Polistes fuscatus TaxID=30207 RepID=UPI001CA86810|nr:uncharacterized protein LOC122513568 isoform X6 [Polistes fuscatus]